MYAKKIRKRLLIFFAVAMVGLGSQQIQADARTTESTEQEGTLPEATPVPTQTPTPTPKPPAVKNGLKKEGSYYRYYVKGKLLKNSWKKVNGKKYYFKSNGNAAVYSNKIKEKYYVFNTNGQLFAPKKNALVKAGSKLYYVNKYGNPVPGWQVLNKKLYYVDKYGRCAVNTKKDGITFTKSGYAKADVHAKLKMKAMEVVKRVTKPSMSKSEKLRACWYHLNTIQFHPWEFPDTTKKYWPQTCALELLNTMSGNCYGFANGFAALAKELGYKPYVIEIPKCHCWVKIDGKYWDNMGNKMGVSYSPMPYKKDQIYKF